MEDSLHISIAYGKMWDGGMIMSDFELRNREPARRVGVRRTIANLGKGKGISASTTSGLTDHCGFGQA